MKCTFRLSPLLCNVCLFLKEYRLISHLLHFSCGALEQLYVPSANTLPMFGQSFVSLSIIGEEHKCITSSSAIGLVHKQDTIFIIQHLAGRVAILEEVQLKENG